MFKLFFFKCFSNFLLSRLTFAFCALLLLTTNYCDVYESISACTFVPAFNILFCIADHIRIKQKYVIKWKRLTIWYLNLVELLTRMLCVVTLLSVYLSVTLWQITISKSSNLLLKVQICCKRSLCRRNSLFEVKRSKVTVTSFHKDHSLNAPLYWWA